MNNALSLGAARERGVDRILEWFADDMTRTMTLIGTGRTDQLDRSFLRGSAKPGSQD